MLLETFNNFPDFELLDSGEGYRLERWDQYRLARPDPQAIWERHLPKTDWDKADAIFDGEWKIRTQIKQPWTINFPFPLKRGEAKAGNWELRLNARLSPFKHTGIFAEQSANWEWITERVGGKKLKVLNLFGYTGGASVLLAKLGCSVTHVDASKPAIGWAKENQNLNNLDNDSIRWILDDAVKFVAREVKRGQKYDAILMDPPAFGHSPSGKTWKFAEDLPKLLTDCVKLLSSDAQFLIINAYATNTSAIALQNVLEDAAKDLKGTIESGELCLKQKDDRLLSTGIFARWLH
jgi:23S rRNA (cytosine1962-C5)-methyltransferase